MHIGQAFDLVSRYDSLRKRRLSLEMMVWCIVGPLHQIVNRLDSHRRAASRN